MTSSELAILVLVIVIAWFAWRRLRRKSPTLTPSMPVNLVGSATRPPVAQNAEQALALLASCAHPQGIGDLTTVVQARIADQGSVDWHFNFTEGSCVLVRGTADGASLTISADSQIWRDLAAKRIGFASALMKGSLKSEGDTAVLMKLDTAFAGPPDESLLVGANQALLSPHAETQSATPNPADERQAAIMEAIRQNLGTGAEGLVNRDGGSVTTPTDPRTTRREARKAIQDALRNLPPGATREQKIAAVRTALETVPDAAPFAAMLDANHAGSLKVFGGKAGEILLEGLFEGLLGGD
ncbi:MAG TPA: SCP2 sterol-binding domain-containing protein [Chloroflexota bacterium]|nr:SCP2 sterol-binding domain-containing protein [Chloroflexota bacterium]